MLRIDLARACAWRGRAAWSRGAHVRARASGKLPACCLTAIDRRRDVAEREVEHVMQQESSALERRQSLERQEQRDGEVLGQLGVTVGRERGRVDDRLRQPWADVLL